MLKIKVCGMKIPTNIEAVKSLKPDFLGFIFYPPSPRYIDQDISEFVKKLPISIQKVGVFVNQERDFIESKIDDYSLNIIQLHGKESAEECAFWHQKIKVIKAFSIGESFDFETLKAYESVCDFFLFDTKGKNHGGNGVTFDWKILDDYPFQKPFFLSGGIDLENLQTLETHHFLYGIDVNSKFEIEAGLKDVSKLQKLFQQWKPL
jgi:phosphoribosylanthranilate isomerase